MLTDARHNRQMALACEIVSEIEASVLDERLPADAALSGIFRRNPGFGARDRRHYSQIVFAYFRWRGWVRKLANTRSAQLAWAVFIDPAMNEEIREIWRLTPGIDPTRAAQLGSFQADDSALSLDDLMPSWLPQVLTDAEVRSEFIVSTAMRPPTWIAVAPAKTAAFSRKLEQLQIKHAVDRRIPGAVSVQPPFTLDRLKSEWREPVQVQDLASQAVVMACDARPGDNWWDACAGSGGKTLSLARAVGPHGSVLATDSRASILENLRKRASESGLQQIRAKEIDASEDTPKAQFDGVLVDAPCSGLGTWSRNPDARWRTGLEAVQKSADAQIGILNSAARCVRPGGTLIYSVCTNTPQETVGLIKLFLSSNADFAPHEFPDPLKLNKPSSAIQIRPHDGPCDGMFIARFNRRSF